MPHERPIGSIQFDNTERVVLVSGGAMGIGLAVCEAFADSGAKVVCFDCDSAAGNRLPDRIGFFSGDTSQEDDCRRAVEHVVALHGGLDVLVNNAAIQPKESYVPLHQFPRELWERMLAINFSGYAFLAKYALRVMLDQQSGVIVNVASGQGHRTARNVPAYGPIKAATIMQTRQWGIEYARQGIRVVSVSPGCIDTPMVRATLNEQGGEAEVANRHPIGRIGRPDEVAASVLWLASPAASFITATDLEVDGGLGAFAAFAEPFSDTCASS
ncbi:MAG: SDR family oxidoreductase [Planctomycetales bacterium]|nr:SDR family oxidoreductase [Planctomycetales bacterium]